MSEPKGKIVNQTGIPREKEFDFWEPVIFTKEDIDNEIERLADLDQPENGFRSSILAHPRAEESSLGLAPGIRVSLDVLRPGEQSRLFRHNATEVNFCIKGSGYTEIAGKKIEYGQYHVVNHPSYTAYRHVNDTDQVQARLTYSNIPLLQRLNVYTADENPPVMAAVEEDRGEVSAVGHEARAVPHQLGPNRGRRAEAQQEADEPDAPHRLTHPERGAADGSARSRPLDRHEQPATR